ncbi:MAG: hypothetical protein HY735_11085 [Verrucomicrobia bacterium]|nr:hypothetical protein [Verrucomicrobiota bacterium]
MRPATAGPLASIFKSAGRSSRRFVFCSAILVGELRIESAVAQDTLVL